MFMGTKATTRVLLAVAAVFVTGKAIAQDGRDDSSWKPLTNADDVSRAALLERVGDVWHVTRCHRAPLWIGDAAPAYRSGCHGETIKRRWNR
jgi:hypothetical protein